MHIKIILIITEALSALLIAIDNMFQKNTLRVGYSSFFLDQIKIPTVEQCRYLGISISANNSDVDLKRQMRKLYANVNLLLRKFSK